MVAFLPSNYNAGMPTVHTSSTPIRSQYITNNEKPQRGQSVSAQPHGKHFYSLLFSILLLSKEYRGSPHTEPHVPALICFDLFSLWHSCTKHIYVHFSGFESCCSLHNIYGKPFCACVFKGNSGTENLSSSQARSMTADAVFNQQPLFRVTGNLQNPVPHGGLSTCLVMSCAQCAIIRSDHWQSTSSDLEREQKRRSPLQPNCCDITPSQCVDNRNKTPGVCHLDSIVSGMCVQVCVAFLRPRERARGRLCLFVRAAASPSLSGCVCGRRCEFRS